MNETVLKIAIAAFMHDIGKFAEDALNVSLEYLNGNADLYQPFNKIERRYTHRHAVFTAAFIEQFEKILPQKLNRVNWGLDDPFINLAAGHHKPETPLQWIIAVADRLSSGWDRRDFDENYNYALPFQHYRRTRLLPLFEKLLQEDGHMPEGSDDYLFCYFLREISPQNIFPGLKAKVIPSDDEEAGREYQRLFQEFVLAMGNLLHKEEDIELWFEHLESLVMIYSSMIPGARAGRVVPDVSLYDHLKISAAFAIALFLYHRSVQDMTPEAIQSYEPKKFLVINGNFYGIQSFISAESGASEKNRAKILRGRSFAVSLMSELAADMLCREIGIPSISVVLNAAGKFTLIGPNTLKAKEAVRKIEERVNSWLIKIAFGENAVGFSYVEAAPRDFVSGQFIQFWNSLAEMAERKKYHKIDLDRYGGVVPGYLELFHNDLKHPLCPLCGKRASDPTVEGSPLIGEDESACMTCRDHIFLGENLVKKSRVAITTINADLKGERLLAPIFDFYQVAFVDGGMKEMARTGSLLKYWDISIDEGGKVVKDVTARFINDYVPVCRAEDLKDERLLGGRKSEKRKEELIDQLKEGMPKTLAHIANKALIQDEENGSFSGIEALGVFKADVDQLGMLFSRGLSSTRLTLARLATLSRQVNWFFSLYLPHLLKTDTRFMDTYTVFAGGDDLFLIGPWNRTIDLAVILHGAFSDYVCGNRRIHFSAGISLKKPNTPLAKLAEAAESAVALSKGAGRNRITLFGETAEWPEFLKIREIGNLLGKWLENGLINNAMAYRLNQFIEMVEREKAILNAGKVSLEDMECLKWYALFHYAAERNVGKDERGEEREKILQEFYKTAEWLKDHGGKMRMALWEILYNRRKEA